MESSGTGMEIHNKYIQYIKHCLDITQASTALNTNTSIAYTAPLKEKKKEGKKKNILLMMLDFKNQDIT